MSAERAADRSVERPGAELFDWQQRAWRRLLAQQRAGRTPHAMLLHGPVGIGKGPLAMYLAASRLCHRPGDQGQPCLACAGCKLFRAGSHPDFRLVAAEAGKRAIRVDQVRGLIDWLAHRPHFAGPKVLVMPAAEQMNLAAANALLKTLEEPAGDALLLLVSARPSGLPATIRSRCQALPLARPARADALAWLADRAASEGLPSGGAAGPAQAPASNGALELALALAGGAPLGALQALRDGLIEPYSALLQDIAGVAGGGLDPVAVAERWAKQDAVRVLGWMLAAGQAMIRSRMLGATLEEPALQGLTMRGSAQTLFAQVDRIALALAQVNGGRNPNIQLLMESLFIPWQSIGAPRKAG